MFLVMIFYERTFIMKKKLTSVLSIILAISVILPTITFSASLNNGQYITSQGACVMDYQTGEVLYQYNGNTPRVPASMTKIMNMYCIYEALKNGEITLDTKVPISQNVYNKSRNPVYQSMLPLNYNTTYTVNEMMDVIVVYSASGAAVAMAELIGGGSEAKFVERMNNTAKKMGIDAYYYDSCGIANNKVSPIAMATLARNIIKEYTDILKRSAKKSVSFHGNSYKTTNHLLDTYYYAGADGLKTGTTSAAGYCFCGTAQRNGNRVITVTMSSSSTGQRFIDTARLMDYGFSVLEAKYNTIYFTDRATYINNAEIPTFSYNQKSLIIAEDLKDYGFDVSWNGKDKKLTIKYNKNKKATPIPTDYYKNKNNKKAFSIIKNNAVKVFLNDGLKEYEIKDIYNVNGYMCIAVNALSDIYDIKWSDNNKRADISVSEKKPKAVLPNGEELTSASAYIMDFETGNTLYEFDADTQKACASIAKMMSVYVILDQIKAGKITPETIVPISENVYNLSRNENYKMMVNLHYDEEYTVDEMLDMIVIFSSAACVTAVAELISGSETEFVKLMNEKAKEIGIGSVFYNGTGVCLNPEVDKENMMSCREIAKMTKKMIEDYPEVLERTKCASVEFHGNTYYNLNKLFTDFYYEGADGFKNGMTDASGYCMAGTAALDGKRVITVTLPSNSNEARFTDSIKMFDYGLSKLGVDTSGTQEKEEIKLDETKEVKVNIDGNYEVPFTDQSPVIKDNRVLVPVRIVMETLEKKVEWSEKTREITIKDDVVKVVLKVNSKTMVKETINPIDNTITKEEITLDCAPTIISGRTLLPIRAVVEAFGAAVIWEEETQTVLIVAGVC